MGTILTETEREIIAVIVDTLPLNEILYRLCTEKSVSEVLEGLSVAISDLAEDNDNSLWQDISDRLSDFSYSCD